MVALALPAIGTALCVACGTVIDIHDGDGDDAASDSGPSSGDSSIDAFDDRRGDGSTDAADADALVPCSDDQQFKSVAEIPDLGDVTSVRLTADEATAFVSFIVSAGNEDIDEGGFPKKSLLYNHVVDTAQPDTHPSPVLDPLVLFLEHGVPGARTVARATRAQVGQAFTITSTPAIAPDAGVETREPYALGDGSVIYFTMEPGEVGLRDVYRAERSGGAWTRTLVDGVSGGLQDGHPVVSNDELAIFFSRADPGPGKPAAVWSASRPNKSAPFTALVPVGKIAGTVAGGAPSDDRPTWLSADRCTLFFTSNRSGAYRAYRATRR